MINSSPESKLHEQFVGKPWFHSVGRDQYNKLVVYVNFSCNETLNDIPDRVDGIQVKVHFAASKPSNSNKYVLSLEKKAYEPELVQSKTLDLFDVIELDSSDLENDLDDLCTELDSIEKQCGSNIMQDIFYEIHDGSNAVTNLGSRYPESKKRLQKLYDEYGFDVIYEEIPG